MRPSSRRLLAALLAGAALALLPAPALAAGSADGVPPQNLLTAPPALPLPAPLSTLLPSVPALTGATGLPASPDLSGATGPAGEATRPPSGLASPANSSASAPAPDAPATSPAAASGGAARVQPQSSPSASLGGGLSGAGYGCLSAGQSNGGGLVIMGQDVLSQLSSALPQTKDFIVPCTTTNGLSADADLVAATVCLRLDPAASSPLRATIELAGTDVLSQLESAGLPLGQVLSPCTSSAPATSRAAPTPVTGPPTSATTAPTDVQAASSADTGGRLPFTGAEVLPTALLGLALVLLGAALLRGRGRHEGGA